MGYISNKHFSQRTFREMVVKVPFFITLSISIFILAQQPSRVDCSPYSSSSSSSSSYPSYPHGASSSSSHSDIVDGNTYEYNYIPSNDDYPRGDPYHAGEDATAYLSEYNSEWASISGRHKPKCVEIPKNLSLCQNIEYNSMTLPNLLGHDSMYEVTRQSQSWVPLVKINCHPGLKIFLCSLYSPVCLDKVIYPCRTLCSSVKASCETVMKGYGYRWPDQLACEKFPEENDMCIKVLKDVKPDDNCAACKHAQTYETLVDHHCRAEIVMKAKLKELKMTGGDRELVLLKKKKFFKVKDGTSKKTAKDLRVVIANGAHCKCDTINSTNDKYLIMGYKSGDVLVVQFAMVWDKRNKEFKKGLRAIKKATTCKEIVEKITVGETVIKRPGSTKSGKSHGDSKKLSRRERRRRRNRRRNKGKNGKRRRRRGKKGRKGRKGKKERKGRKGRRNRKEKGDNGEGTSTGSGNSRKLSKAELEDIALSNFRRASN